jgi:hypothetical protein
MEIKNYTDKSFVLCGEETKNHKDYIKELGGKWNPNLTTGPGWIFSINQKEKVHEWIKTKSPKDGEKSSPIINKKEWGVNLERKKNQSPISSVSSSSLSEELIEELIEEIRKNNKHQEYEYEYEYEYENNVKKYRDVLLKILSKKNISFSEYCSLDIDKIIEYSYLCLLSKK